MYEDPSGQFVGWHWKEKLNDGDWVKGYHGWNLV